MILRALPRPVPRPAGQGHVVVAAVVLERGLAGPHLAADVDDLPGAPEGRVEGHPVPALDDLGPRGAEPEVEAALGQRVDPGRRHGDERGGPGEDGQDGRADLHRLGQGGQVAHLAGAVDAVGLGHPHQVQARLLHLGHLGGGLAEPAGVAEHRADLHRRPRSIRLRTRHYRGGDRASPLRFSRSGRPVAGRSGCSSTGWPWPAGGPLRPQVGRALAVAVDQRLDPDVAQDPLGRLEADHPQGVVQAP